MLNKRSVSVEELDTPHREIPELVAYPSKNGVHLITEPCCYCGKNHLHGIGGDPANPAYSHRLAHCADGNVLDYAGYDLVPPRPGLPMDDQPFFEDLFTRTGKARKRPRKPRR